MVVDRATLFAKGYFQGFAPAGYLDYYHIILDNYYYESRDLVETKPALKQPIAYCVILNKDNSRVFAYQRSTKDGHYEEKRLRGKWSWGIGGHIDKIDLEGKDPITTSMLREIQEETTITTYDDPEVLGYINDDISEVGQVHFGLLFLIKTHENNIKPRDKEIAWGGFLELAELEDIYSANEASVETWSGISLISIRELLSKNKNA